MEPLVIGQEHTLGFGIVGLGNIARFHVRAISALPGCKVVAVASRDPERREALAAELGAAACSDCREMLLVPGLDVVCICTPSGEHLEPALAAARAGKHVVCEKPLEIDVARAERIVLACAEAGVELACIFQNRYSDPYRELRDVVATGSLGRLVLGNAYVKWYRPPEYYAASEWRGTLRGDGGAALINQGIHTLDLLLDVMGKVRSVRGRVATLRHGIEGEDVGAAVLEFESGALGTIEASTSIYAAFPERLEVHGSEGSVVLEGGKIAALRTRTGQSSGSRAPIASSASDPLAIDPELHRRQYSDIVHAIRAGRSPALSGAQGLAALRVVRAIYESSQSGREVLL